MMIQRFSIVLLLAAASLVQVGCDSNDENEAPSISSVTPNSGPVNGGTTVSIKGENFVSGATVAFAGIPAINTVFQSSTEITAVTPSRASTGAVDVSVTNPDDGRGTLGEAYTYE